MSTETRVNQLTNIGAIADNDLLVGERIDGTTVRIQMAGLTATAAAIATLTNDLNTAEGNIVTLQGNISTINSTAYFQGGTDVAVTDGGSGRSSATAYTPIVGGITTTGAHQSMASAGSAGQMMQSAGGSAVPVWTTAAFADTYSASVLLYSNGANNVEGLPTAASGLLITDGSGVPSIGTDIPTAVTVGGQYNYRAGGTDISVTDGGTGLSTMTTAYAPVCAGTTATGALQVASTGLSTAGYVLTSNGAGALPSFQAATGGVVNMTWTTASGTTQAAAVATSYVTTNGSLCTITLPATAAVGDRVGVAGQGSGGWKMAANTGQTIQVGSVATSSAGSFASANRYDTAEVVCIVANTTWSVTHGVTAGYTIL